MFEIGFGEIILVMIVGLIVLGPERLPVAVKTVAGWIRAMRSIAASVQNELTQELKLQELQNSIKNVEKSALQELSPELKASMDELRAAAQAMQKTYQQSDTIKTQLENVPVSLETQSEVQSKVQSENQADQQYDQQHDQQHAESTVTVNNHDQINAVDQQSVPMNNPENTQQPSGNR